MFCVWEARHLGRRGERTEGRPSPQEPARDALCQQMSIVRGRCLFLRENEQTRLEASRHASASHGRRPATSTGTGRHYVPVPNEEAESRAQSAEEGQLPSATASRRSWQHECRPMAARAGRCATCAGWLSLVTEPMVQASGAALEHVAVMLTWVGRIPLRDVLTRQQVARSATSLQLGRLSAA